MASVSMAMSPLTHKGLRNQPISGALLKQLPLRPSNKPVFMSSRSRSIRVVQVQASLKEKAITGLATAVLTASMVLPEAAEAASSFSPSLKNFLLSIGAGGVVLTALLGAVIGVANFDPVKRT